MLPGLYTSRLRMVYNWRDGIRLGGSTLIGAGLNACKMVRGPLTVLILVALATTILIGCGEGSSQTSGEGQGSGTSGSRGQKSEDAGSSGRVSGERDGHPTLGAADAPVVMTEYSDYQ